MAKKVVKAAAKKPAAKKPVAKKVVKASARRTVDVAPAIEQAIKGLISVKKPFRIQDVTDHVLKAYQATTRILLKPVPTN